MSGNFNRASQSAKTTVEVLTTEEAASQRTEVIGGPFGAIEMSIDELEAAEAEVIRTGVFAKANKAIDAAFDAIDLAS